MLATSGRYHFNSNTMEKIQKTLGDIASVEELTEKALLAIQELKEQNAKLQNQVELQQQIMEKSEAKKGK